MTDVSAQLTWVWNCLDPRLQESIQRPDSRSTLASLIDNMEGSSITHAGGRDGLQPSKCLRRG